MDFNGLEKYPPHLSDAYLRIIVEPQDSLFRTGNRLFGITVKFLAPNLESQKKNSVLEGKSNFRIPGINAYHPLHGLSYTISVYIQSHLRDGPGYCWGPDTTIRHLKVELEHPVPEDSPFAAEMLAAPAHLAIRPLHLFVRGCTCGGISQSCEFCQGGVEQYDRVDPLIARDNTMRDQGPQARAVPIYEFATSDALLDPLLNPKPPSYAAPWSEQQARYIEIAHVFGALPSHLQSIHLRARLVSEQLARTERAYGTGDPRYNVARSAFQHGSLAESHAALWHWEERVRRGACSLQPTYSLGEQQAFNGVGRDLLSALRRAPPRSTWPNIRGLKDLMQISAGFCETLQRTRRVESEEHARLLSTLRLSCMEGFLAVPRINHPIESAMHATRANRRPLPLPNRPAIYIDRATPAPDGEIPCSEMVSALETRLETLRRRFSSVTDLIVLDSFNEDLSSFKQVVEHYLSLSNVTPLFRWHVRNNVYWTAMALENSFSDLFESIASQPRSVSPTETGDSDENVTDINGQSQPTSVPAIAGMGLRSGPEVLDQQLTAPQGPPASPGGMFPEDLWGATLDRFDPDQMFNHGEEFPFELCVDSRGDKSFRPIFFFGAPEEWDNLDDDEVTALMLEHDRDLGSHVIVVRSDPVNRPRFLAPDWLLVRLIR